MNDSSRHIFTLVFLSMGLLVLLSLLPWSSLTGNVIKDFNLFEDLMPSKEAPAPSESGDNLSLNDGDGGAPLSALPDSIAAEADSTALAEHDSTTIEMPVYEHAPRNAEGIIEIENYTGGDALAHFRAALAQAQHRPVRVAVIGDSYIEGDIFCQNLRDILQRRYGGSGVGFMALHTEFPGFRQSVRQSGSGWTMHDIRNLAHRDTLRTLSGVYAKASLGAKAKFEASQTFPGTTRWQRSSFQFLAPDSGSITLAVADNEITFDVAPSPDVQILTLPGSTDRFTITSNVPRLVALGAYLDGGAGVQVDCMSVRGNSGMPLRYINRRLCSQMAAEIPYDLIILEFGMNAVNPDQTDYTAYGLSMSKAIERLKSIYPNADILVMGVGDRGIKNGAAVVSMPSCVAMVKAQRELARREGLCFWDTREAMGADGACADWRTRKLINADYIHLNHKGGAELATLFSKSLNLIVNE